MVCRKCGQKNVKIARYCETCGWELDVPEKDPEGKVYSTFGIALKTWLVLCLCGIMLALLYEIILLANTIYEQGLIPISKMMLAASVLYALLFVGYFITIASRKKYAFWFILFGSISSAVINLVVFILGDSDKTGIILSAGLGSIYIPVCMILTGIFLKFKK